MEETRDFSVWRACRCRTVRETRIRETASDISWILRTGKNRFLLDQKYNRRAAAALAGGKRCWIVLPIPDLFALSAKAGAACVHAVDISADAVAMAQRNARLNGLEANMSFETANVFDLLHSLPGQPYDYIILDPPAFTKSHQTVDAALRGYKEINLRAMKLLPAAGIWLPAPALTL